MSNGQGSSRMGESERGPEKGEAYGVAAVTQKLQGIDFPITKKELMQQHGTATIQWTKGGESFKLEDCLQKLPDKTFNSIVEITAAVSNVLQEKTGSAR